jgi:DNA modification methylase
MLKTLPDCSVDCCVTSPPYYGLRDYGTGKWVGGDPNCEHKGNPIRTREHINENYGQGFNDVKGKMVFAPYKQVCPLCGAKREDYQIGLEETPEEFIERLVLVFSEVRRVLKPDGTCWVNMGDSYCGTGDKGNFKDPKNPNGRNGQSVAKNKKVDGCKSKDLIGIPWMLAFALRADGWYLRQDIIWQKPNPMPESVRDRCTKSHEYIFLLSKSSKYYFDNDAIKENAKPDNSVRDRDHTKLNNCPGRTKMGGLKTNHYTKRNKRDVWNVPTQPVKEAHFATFPEKLIEPCILAGCKQGGVVLDPFFGSGTTGIVAERYGRDYIGIELNPEYVKIAERRLNGVQMRLPIA